LTQRCRRKFWRQAPLASEARWEICGVVDLVFLVGSGKEASLSVGALLGELLSGDLEGYGEESSGDGHHPMG